MVRILIADDHAKTRKVLQILLAAHRGWEVCAALENGHEAVLRTIELRPDVVILDLWMPLLDGISAAREILKVMPAIPILLLTIYSTPDIEQAAKAAGIKKILNKNDAVRVLLGSVEAVLQETPPHGRVREPR